MIIFVFETYSQLTDQGQLTDHSSPWLKQMCDDLLALHSVDNSVPDYRCLAFGFRSFLMVDSPLKKLSFRKLFFLF